MLKRTLDVVFSTLGLLLLSPLLATIAILVKLEDGGPVFYCGTRVGRAGVPFPMMKFRTMLIGADRMGVLSTADNDPRLTRTGRLLRKSKLDELPQLVNVLRGEMSLVGPRPEVPEYVALFTPREHEILSVRPGITDWASLWNSDEGSVLAHYSDPDHAYRELIRPTKLRLQLLYVTEQSLLVDLHILGLTLLRLLGRSGLPARIRGLLEPTSVGVAS